MSRKILQLGKFYPVRGGVEKVMYDLMIGLSEEGVSCDMLCASTEDYPAGRFEMNGHARLLVVPTKIKLAATMLAPSMIQTLRRIAKNYDVIHIHHPDPMACLALFMARYKGKVVLHWHSDILKQKTMLRFYKPLQSWLIRRADIIVGTTPVYVQESPFLRDVQVKTDYIPIGIVPVEGKQKRIDEIKKQYAGKFLVFSLGRLVEYKGYEYLIKAAQWLDDQFHIVIGGKGPLMESLSILINELGVADRVTLLGFVLDEDVPAYFAASDLFCLSSIYKTEAFAIVQIEAMSCGKPVVSTHIPGSGVSWVNQHGSSGLVVAAGDPIALALSIRKVFDENILREHLKAGSLQRFQECFTRDKMIQKTIKIYNNLFVGKDE